MNIVRASIIAAAVTLTGCAATKGMVAGADKAAADADAAQKQAEAAKAEADAKAAEADAAAKLAASLDDAIAVNAKLVEGALLIDVRAADKATDPLPTAKPIPAADWAVHKADFETLTGNDKTKGVVLYSDDGKEAVQVRDALKAEGYTAVWAQRKDVIVVTEARANAKAEVKGAIKGKGKKK